MVRVSVSNRFRPAMNLLPSGATDSTDDTPVTVLLRSTTPDATSKTKTARLAAFGMFTPIMYRPSRLVSRKLRLVSAGRLKLFGGASGLAGGGGGTATGISVW